MKKIFWIASYPKSGNTWVRAILSSLFFTEDGRFDFHLLNYIKHFDNADKFNFVRNLDLNDFNRLNELAVISKYWTEAQKRAEVGGEFSFFKTHSGNVTVNKFQYTNPSNTLGLIYVVRDPRDIVVSYSRYLDKSADAIIGIITNKNAIATNGIPKNKPYPILISSWDIHYKTWKLLDVPKLVIKYEMLLKETKQTLNQIISFFTQNYGFSFNNIEAKINNILETTSFKRLHETEKKNGFIEAPYFHSNKKTAEYFFRKGTDKQWHKELNKIQLNKIESSFETTMVELGYLK